MRGQLLRSVTNALEILRAFDFEHTELRVSELANRLDIAPSTAHRLVSTLVASGFLEPTGRRSYRLGVAAIQIGALALQHRGFGGAIQPAMEEVSRATNETVNVAVLEETDILYVAVLESKAVLRPYFSVGQRGPANRTALGKALIAFAGEEQKWPRRLHKELETIRAEGVAYDLEESEPGVVCVAVPILQDGRAVAAISVAGPASRMTREAMREAVRPLSAASATIARTLSLGSRS